MSRITTLVLVALALLLGGLYFYLSPRLRVAEELSKNPRILTSFDPARVTEIFFENLQRGVRAKIRRAYGGWELVTPVQYPAEKAYIDTFLNPIQHNECTIVADLSENPSFDLEPYGLDKPRAVLRIHDWVGVREILIGQEDLAGSQAFVLSESRVLKTSRNLYGATERSLEELRSRETFWMPFDRVREFEAERGGVLVRAVWKQGVWYLESPWQGPADTAALSTFIAAALGMRVHKFYDDHPGEDSTYGLDPPAMRIAVASPEGREEIKIGRSGDGELLAKKTGFPFVWEIEQSASKLFDLKPAEFRERVFFRLFRDEVEEIRIGAKGGEIVFVRKQGQWAMASPREYTLEPGAVEDLLEAALQLQAEEFEEAGGENRDAAFGLDAPSRWVQVRSRGGDPIKLLIGKSNGKGQRYARRAEGGSVALLPEMALRFLESEPIEYAARNVLSLSEHDLRGIEIQHRRAEGNLEASWTRDEKGLWRRKASSGDLETEEDKRFAAELDLFLFWKGKRVVSEDPSGYGFERPLLQILFWGSASQHEHHPILQIPVVRGADGKYFTRGRSNLVYELDAAVFERVLSLMGSK